MHAALQVVTSSTPSAFHKSPTYLKGIPASARHLPRQADLTNCTPSQGPMLCYRGAKHAHCSSRGPPSTNPSYAPFFLNSLPPCIPVWIREWRLFHEASAERQSISYIWWISLDWDKLGSRTKRYVPPLAPAPSSQPYPILQPPLPPPS